MSDRALAAMRLVAQIAPVWYGPDSTADDADAAHEIALEAWAMFCPGTPAPIWTVVVDDQAVVRINHHEHAKNPDGPCPGPIRDVEWSVDVEAAVANVITVWAGDSEDTLRIVYHWKPAEDS